jgi:hypothetical protein
LICKVSFCKKILSRIVEGNGSACHGRVFLSGYASVLSDKRLARWDRVEFDLPNRAGQERTKGRRVEVLRSR